ncbi:MAG: hypothetical protein AABZ39_16315 [Spirochaetota bacterium]
MNIQTLLSQTGNLGGALNTIMGVLGQARSAMSPSAAAQPITQENSARAIEELTLIVVTLTNLLFAKGIITSEEFNTKFNELDLKDGIKDGKMAK